MPGPIHNNGATGSSTVPVPGRETTSSDVDARDVDSFANQVDGADAPVEEEQAQKDELLELMKKSSFNQFVEKQKEMEEEIKKNLE